MKEVVSVLIALIFTLDTIINLNALYFGYMSHTFKKKLKITKKSLFFLFPQSNNKY